MMKLKIFSDPSFLPPGAQPVSILKPFWGGEATSKVDNPWQKSLDNFTKISHLVFDFTALEDADIIVLPFDWLHVTGNTWTAKRNEVAYNLGCEFIRKFKSIHKPIVIFFSSDRSHEDIPFNDVFVFRQSILASRKSPRDFVMTAMYEDLVSNYLGDKVIVREKKDRPVIGFAGFADLGSWKNSLKSLVHRANSLVSKDSFLPYEGHRLRNVALQNFYNSTLVESNFIIRNNMAFFGTSDPGEKLRLRLEYVNNIIESDYTFCCRGRGNFSIRLFETLCCGRIPIFLNTDCALPYDFKIDWKKYAVWVNEHELPNIVEKVLEFHENLSSQEFIDLQCKCRGLWEVWLSNEGFMANLHEHFNRDLNSIPNMQKLLDQHVISTFL